MSLTTRVRQAKLKPECAERYPTLPVGMWTSASCLAGLVAPSPGAWPERPEDRAQDRTLSVADFQFRGGCPGWSRGLLARTRIADAH